ncbi:MAG: hypothetical protein JST68_21595 [Bacteroidetes bacterium]|nr:hypothetical protein [Bacteroidota bacterium]
MKIITHLPKWVYIGLIATGALMMVKLIFSHNTLIVILLFLMSTLAIGVYLFRKRINISNRNGNYYRNFMASVSIFLGLLILADHDQIAKHYCKIFMDNPRFYYSEEVDDYGQSSRELDVGSEGGFSLVPTIIQWGIVGVGIGLPFLVWRLSNASFKN